MECCDGPPLPPTPANRQALAACLCRLTELRRMVHVALADCADNEGACIVVAHLAEATAALAAVCRKEETRTGW